MEKAEQKNSTPWVWVVALAYLVVLARAVSLALMPSAQFHAKRALVIAMILGLTGLFSCAWILWLSRVRRREAVAHEVAARESARFLAAAEGSADAFYILESERDDSGAIVDFRIRYVNANGEKMLRRDRSEIVGKLLCVEWPVNITGGFLEKYKRVVETGEPLVDEFAIEGDVIDASWLRNQVVKLGDGIAVTSSDISALKSTQQRYKQLAEFTHSLFENAPFSMIATDRTGMITAMNAAAEKLCKMERKDAVGKMRLTELHDPQEIQARREALAAEGHEMAADFDVFAARPLLGQMEESEWSYVRRDGTRTPVNVAVTAIRSAEGEVTGFISTGFDITDRKQMIERVTHLATHDHLTGLVGRSLLDDRIAQAISRVKRYGKKLAVFVLDLDHFKRVNDSLGHQAGDEVILEMAERLRKSVRRTDTVARVGGDEFVVVMPDIDNMQAAEACAANLVRQMSAKTAGVHRVHVTASLGWCLYPDFAPDGPTLLQRADAAMYAAKEEGGDQPKMFSEPMLQTTSNRMLMEGALRDALEKGELSLHYQPQVSFATGRVTGMEALLRWTHPELGVVSPAHFIPVAEEAGLIVTMGEWVFRQSCLEAVRIQRELGLDLMLSVNLSPRQLRHPRLLSVIGTALGESGLPPEQLEIEITESMLMQDSKASAAVLQSIRAMGCRIAIDDFGTGFSSFSYLLEYQVDRLKVDQSFVKRAVMEPNAAAVVRAIIAMSHSLGIKVVAEGVETQEQLQFLVRRKCDEAQGYYFSKPMPASGFARAVDAIHSMQAELAGSEMLVRRLG